MASSFFWSRMPAEFVATERVVCSVCGGDDRPMGPSRYGRRRVATPPCPACVACDHHFGLGQGSSIRASPTDAAIVRHIGVMATGLALMAGRQITKERKNRGRAP